MQLTNILTSQQSNTSTYNLDNCQKRSNNKKEVYNMVPQLVDDNYKIICSYLPAFYLRDLRTVSKGWHQISKDNYTERFNRVWNSISKYMSEEKFDEPYALGLDPDFYFFNRTKAMDKKWTFRPLAEGREEKLNSAENWEVIAGFGASLPFHNLTRIIKIAYAFYKACRLKPAKQLLALSLNMVQWAQQPIYLELNEFNKFLAALFQNRDFTEGFNFLEKLSPYWNAEDIAESWDIFKKQGCLENQHRFLMILENSPNKHRFTEFFQGEGRVDLIEIL